MDLRTTAARIHEASKQSKSGTCSTREMSSKDELTHNFTGDIEVTELFLQKYGQVFINGQRFEL